MPSSIPAPPVPTSAQTSTPAPPPTADLLGVPLALADYEQTLDWMDAMVASKSRGYLCVAAVHTVMACREDDELHGAVLGASFTVPDGQPLVWALRALGHDLPSRIYGPELMARWCQRGALTGARAFLYGGRDEDALRRLTDNLRERFPGLQIVGSHSPPFRELTAAEQDALVEEVNRARPDIVWVGIGVPKQEKWMAALRGRLDAPLLVGVGAAFDFHAGLVPQAPGWMQRRGLEWIFRLAKEPRRLWRRYARYNPRFVTGFVRQYLRHRRGR